MVLHKGELEAQLHNEHQLIKSGVLRDENPLDQSEVFNDFLLACRRGDLRQCQEMISAGVNINGKDQFDYTPLIVASLCGHYELVQLLLESGALAERNTFQGERCIYNALNDRIRNLLLSYDFSKSADPLQPWSSHITSLLTMKTPKTADITLIAASDSFELHKFILAARSPYFRRKLLDASDNTFWKLPPAIPSAAFWLVIQYLYLSDLPQDLTDSRSTATEEDILTSADKISKQLELDRLWDSLLTTDRRLARQRYQDEVNRAQQQMDAFFRENVLDHKMIVDSNKVGEIRWRHDNAIFADCLLAAEEQGEEDSQDEDEETAAPAPRHNGIPVGPAPDHNISKKTRRSVVYPVHKAMLVRSPYFETMFSSSFKEGQVGEHLHVITLDCPPGVLEIVLSYLYTGKSDCPLELALDLLYTADMLFLDKLKTKAVQVISTLGSGNNNLLVDRTHGAATAEPGEENEKVEVEPINIYDVTNAAWELNVQRLEEFAARYLAYRLEDYIDEPEFAELIKQSAGRLKSRQETDTIVLLDDVRYYLSERFRLRFEDAGLEEFMDGKDTANAGDVADVLSPQGEGPDEEEVALSGSLGVTKPEDAESGEGGVATLDGEVAEDEFASDAINYQVLLDKIDTMLENLNLDA
ncbi:BTB/POZ domain-containing protein [Sodiomyces alkalinus F11]|uniref:BTB/POZ domain-containing protein n=1 Tax=Sodiomyces alkalinus (strain CBS 110278 / VKM F-3762 / F11) TaxID=1314773 RepID=A0A3N2PLK7_SODAK|nr:BTB/POZ domain-containing protein [Sodiomyces alkalinus F11]ROT35407.1 BTB/POZ domain-containing protein [Sodiomyces alkalinus F11]